MKVELAKRAEELAGACTHEFLKDKRRKEEWDKVSLIQDKMIKLKANVCA